MVDTLIFKDTRILQRMVIFLLHVMFSLFLHSVPADDELTVVKEIAVSNWCDVALAAVPRDKDYEDAKASKHR